MTRTIRMQRFRPENIKKNRVLLITGKRGTGKTTLLENLMFLLRDRFDVAIGIGGTQASVDMLRKFIPEALIYNRPDLDVINKMVGAAKTLVEGGRRREFLLVLDDCTYDKNLFRQPIFREIFMNGRNFGFTFVISAQYIMDLHTDLRSQIDYVFTFRENIIANRKRLHEYFYGMIDTREHFDQILNEFTKDFECLVMDNTDGSGEIEKQLYFYKAPTYNPQFTIGAPIYRMLSVACTRSGVPNSSALYAKLDSRGSQNKPGNGILSLSGSPIGSAAAASGHMTPAQSAKSLIIQRAR